MGVSGFMQFSDPDLRAEYESVLDKLVGHGWIHAWVRKGDSYAIRFTELGKQRAAWLRIIDDDLKPTDREASTILAFVRRFVRPRKD
jgi:hypothetical protein